MIYKNMTQLDIISLLGYKQPWKGNFKKIIKNQEKRNVFIVETGKNNNNNKLYSLTVPDYLYTIPSDFVLVKDNLTLKEAGEYLNYTYESMKSCWETLKERQLKNFDRLIIKYNDLIGRTKIAIAEKPSYKNKSLKNEQWVILKQDNNYEISSMGRLRKSETKEILQGYKK